MIVLPWLIAIGLALADEIVFSKLLRIEYTDFHADWENDGKPRGVFWVPDEAKIGRWFVSYATGHAGQLARWRWLFVSPRWAREVNEANRLITLHRVLLPAFLVCLIAPFVIAALTQSHF